MYLFYIDESGNTGADLDNTDQPIHWLVGLGVKPGVLRAIETEMLAIALNHFPKRAKKPEFEFHGSQIFGRRGDCNGWSGEQAIALYSEILSVVARHECALFITGIDKPKLRKRPSQRGTPDHPYRIAFMYLVERIDEWLDELQPSGDSSGGESERQYGLLVADEQQEVERQVIEGFAHWRDVGTEYGWGGREIRYLIDTVHYVTSQDSWLIQLADCAAYLFQRYEKVKRQKGNDRAAYTAVESVVVRLWEDTCAGKVARYYLWPG